MTIVCYFLFSQILISDGADRRLDGLSTDRSCSELLSAQYTQSIPPRNTPKAALHCTLPAPSSQPAKETLLFPWTRLELPQVVSSSVGAEPGVEQGLTQPPQEQLCTRGSLRRSSGCSLT